MGSLHALGVRGEDAAVGALVARGYRILARNERSRAGELDVVCLDRGVVVFCEVKARRPSAFGDAREALTAAKRERLARLAAGYLARIGRRGAQHRIELVAVTLDGRGMPGAVEVVPVELCQR